MTKNQKRVSRTRQLYWDLLLQSKCIDCGEDDSLVLIFDHIDPRMKLYDVSVAATRSKKKLLEEVAKCVVRCANCQRKKKATDSKWPIIEYIINRNYEPHSS